MYTYIVETDYLLYVLSICIYNICVCFSYFDISLSFVYCLGSLAGINSFITDD